MTIDYLTRFQGRKSETAISLGAGEIDLVRRDARLLRECADLAKFKASSPRLLDLKKTNAMLKSFVTEKKSGGQRLNQIATILLITPDPITDAAALPVLLAAQIVKMRSQKRNDIQRIVEGAKSDLKSLFSLADLSSF